MPRIIVRDKAIADVDEAVTYIARDNLTAAVRFYDSADSTFSFLASNPLAGTRVDPSIAKYSELRFYPLDHFRNYLVFYVPMEDGVEIVRVIHGMRLLRNVLLD